jgi:hypothetical protein
MDIKDASDRLLKRVDELIVLGDKVLGTRYSDFVNLNLVQFVDTKLFMQWHMSCTSFLSTIPEKFGYSQRYAEHCKDFTYDSTKKGLGVLLSVKDDISSGWFQDVETLVSAEVFDDFLDMAEYLLDNGYKDPTASLIGAVLEDSLRRICKNGNIPMKSREDISSLNSKLAAKGVYNRLQQKQIQVWNDIRNNADHGKFEEYTEDNVRNMLEGVRNFLSSQLG